MKKIIVFCVLFLFPFLALAGDNAQQGIKKFDHFEQIPVLDNGRVKPLDTYARNLLIQFSGNDTLNRKPAIAWLAAVLFDVEKTKADPVFLINNPDIATALGIDPVPHRRYSYNDLQKSFPKLVELAQAARNIQEKQRSVVENEIIRVLGNIELYADLSREFNFTLPADDFDIRSKGLLKQLDLPDQGQFSFLDIALRADHIQRIVKGIDRIDENDWTPEQVQMMNTLSSLFHWSLMYKDMSLTLIPSEKAGRWLSPWDVLGKDFKDAKNRRLLGLWQEMAVDFRQGRESAFDLSAKEYLGLINIHPRFNVELVYNKLRPFFIAKIFYILTLVFFCISFMSKAGYWYRACWIALLLGFIPHVFGLVVRIIIMARPPVTSLYESFIFVSFIGVLLGIIIERVNKQWLGIVVASISGVVLLFIASKYSAEGDTLKMLVAVLNSNFWLGTHVTTITMGYGATCVAGVLGHIWLLQASAKKPQDVLNNTFSVMMGILGLSLTLTFIGTNLGGIWADQSWGRFWGWDPKENGALMIVLWSTLLFHLRIAKLAGPLGMAVGNVLGMMVVMWAWFGVNLLSIGLHSYGFTSGIANTLICYAVCEIIFIIVTMSIIKHRNK